VEGGVKERRMRRIKQANTCCRSCKRWSAFAVPEREKVDVMVEIV
jgi:hypothetical protein